ncbi:ComF family protein [Agrilactobacillus fermenti]|uniref:ComF family protein n=1 Tax=Agrilactobacillus fermenti TaxID=2586909 RepID=UPI003A5C3CA7
MQTILKLGPIMRPTVCSSCLDRFVPINHQNACPSCQRYQEKRTVCQDCQFWQAKYPGESFRHHALFYYDDQMQQFFQDYKARGDFRLATVFSSVINDFFRHHQFDTYCCLPPDLQRLANRGFDHVKALFSSLETLDLLQKRQSSQPQAQKNRQQRLATPQIYSFSGDYPCLKHPRSILLLDDIYTTGRTLTHARMCLREAGFKGKIVTFSLVRA